MARNASTEDRAEPAVKRALAIVLMQEVLPLLDALGEDVAANHLQLAIDTVMQRARTARPEGSC